MSENREIVDPKPVLDQVLALAPVQQNWIVEQIRRHQKARSSIVLNFQKNGGHLTRVRDRDDRGRERILTFAFERVDDNTIRYAAAAFHRVDTKSVYDKTAHNETAIARLKVRPMVVHCEAGLPAQKDMQDFLHDCFVKLGARGERQP